MPVYHYLCSACKTQIRRLLRAGTAPFSYRCACGGEAVRAPEAPTAKAVEVLDNGLMQKRLERPADAQRLFRERSNLPKEKQ